MKKEDVTQRRKAAKKAKEEKGRLNPVVQFVLLPSPRLCVFA
jgi:hypothetical protein